MVERQPEPRGDGLAVAWRIAAPVIVSGLGAHVVIVGMTEYTSSIPLLTALFAAVAFAGVSLALASQRTDGAVGAHLDRLAIPRLQSDGLVLGAIGIGAWLIGHLLGTGTEFYCEPLVPWRIEIALFGSFTVGSLAALAHARRQPWAAYPLTMVAFLWIAPFYGFFSAPLFLGISLNSMCPDRPLATVVLAALGMLIGEKAGRGFAGWLSGT
jgi:hypothetical protein